MDLNTFLKSAGVNLEDKSNVELFTHIYRLFLNLNTIIIAPSKSDFYHLGTVNELLDYYLNVESIESIKFRQSLCFVKCKPQRDDRNRSGCVLYSKLGPKCKISELSLVECCFFDVGLNVNDYCFLNNCSIKTKELNGLNLDVSSLNLNIPPNVCMHTIPISVNNQIKYTTIFFNRNDDLKKNYSSINDIKLLGECLPKELSGLKLENSSNNSIWTLRIFKYLL